MLCGDSGFFIVFVEWIEGDLKDVNLYLCFWVSGEQLKEVCCVNLVENVDVMVKVVEKFGDGVLVLVVNVEMQWQVLKVILLEMVDGIFDVELYLLIFFILFFNWYLWGLFNFINYCFCLNGDNYEECIMECMYLIFIFEDGNYEFVCEIYWLDVDDDWIEVLELGMLVMIFN